MLVVNNNFSKIQNYKKSEARNQVAFQAFMIKDTETLVNNFLRLTKDEAILRLEKALEENSNDKMFHKVLNNLKNIKDSAKAVFDASAEAFELKSFDFDTEFKLPEKMRAMLTEMGKDDKNGKFLNKFINGIASAQDEVVEKVKSVPEISQVSVKTEKEKLVDLVEEAKENISNKKRNQMSDKIKSSLAAKKQEISQGIVILQKEIRVLKGAVNRYWGELEKATKLSSSDGSLQRMQELFEAKEIAEGRLKLIEPELKDLLANEKRFK